MSGAGEHISALFRCRRLLWSSCGRPMSASSRAAPTRPSAGASPLTPSLALPRLSYAKEADLEPSAPLELKYAAYGIACLTPSITPIQIH